VRRRAVLCAVCGVAGGAWLTGDGGGPPLPRPAAVPKPAAPEPAGLEPAAPTPAGLEPAGLDAAAAWGLLAAGNARYVAHRERHPDADPRRRAQVAGGQHPYAIVLGCVDSRVPPEIVFDVGLGDLLVVRTAGHVLDESVLGSIAFGVAELGVPLVLVLGHERCGAVTAAVE
jgi:carbonic anhydrase